MTFIHPKVYFFCLLMLPALFVRVVIFHRRSPVKNLWLRRLTTLLGTVQDAFVSWQGIFLIMAVKVLVPFAFPFLFWVFGITYFLLQADLVFDGLLFYGTAMRVDVAFFSFLDDLKSFWDSAKARGIFAFIGLCAVLALVNISLTAFLQNHLWTFNFSKPFLIAGMILGTISIFGHGFLPRRIAYATTNALLLQQLAFIKKGCAIARWAINLSKDFVMPNKRLFFSEHEEFTLLSPEYPILKFTHGFVGEQLFNIYRAENEQPNIIFLFMESWRAKDVGALGGKHGVTPNFDRLAEKGILFRNFYSNSVKTSRAVTASLFGIPSDIEAYDASSMPNFPLISIADILKRAGYRNNYFLASDLGFENQRETIAAHGFDNLMGKHEILKAFPEALFTSWGVHDEYLLNATVEHLKGATQPQFTTLFTISNHHPWIDPPGEHRRHPLPAFDKADRGRYLRTYHYSDHCLGKFVDQLEQAGIMDNTILFVMGDHGQPMGEHQKSYVNQIGIYEENIHVPCMIYAPGRISKPCQIDQLGSHIDLFPTVMDILGLKGLNHTVGSSLMRKNPAKKVFFHNPFVHGYFACRYDNTKLIYTRATKEVELYDLDLDPKERHNLSTKYPELAKELLSDVRCYETFFKRLYREKIISPQTITEAEHSFEQLG